MFAVFCRHSTMCHFWCANLLY